MARPEFAYYYGDWFWDGKLTDWVKSLLLFFDGIALGVPEGVAKRRIEADPVLAQPLIERGLLHNYFPEVYAKLMSNEEFRKYIERFATVVANIPEDRPLSKDDVRNLEATLPSSEARDAMMEFGCRYSLARQRFGENPSYERTFFGANFSRVLIECITEIAIQPVVDDEDAALFVAAIIDSHDNGRAKIMTDDLRYVGIDFQAVPVDEVLDFRRQHGSEYRIYSQEVRNFVLELSQLSQVDRASALEERRAQLNDRAEELRKTARSAFKRQTVSLGFGLAGAVWTLVHGDAWGGIFTAGAAAAGLSAPTPGPIGAAYTYVLQAKTELSR